MTLLNYFFDLTSIYRLEQKYKNIFICFLVEIKTLKSPFEINWPWDLNKWETDWHFLQNFQCTTILIYAFCKICEREFIFVYFCGSFFVLMFLEQFQFHSSYKTSKSWNKLVLIWKNWSHTFATHPLYFISYRHEIVSWK